MAAWAALSWHCRMLHTANSPARKISIASSPPHLTSPAMLDEQGCFKRLLPSSAFITRCSGSQLPVEGQGPYCDSVIRAHLSANFLNERFESRFWPYGSSKTALGGVIKDLFFTICVNVTSCFPLPPPAVGNHCSAHVIRHEIPLSHEGRAAR